MAAGSCHLRAYPALLRCTASAPPLIAVRGKYFEPETLENRHYRCRPAIRVLITARFAAEQGREIFACPGSPLDPRAEGANQLLRDGASFCTCAEDVIEAMAQEEPVAKEASRGLFESDAWASFDGPLWDEIDLSGATGMAPTSAAPEFEAARVGGNTGLAGSGDPRLPVDVQAGQPAADVAARLAELLGPAPVSVDELARLAEAPARQVRTVLIELELTGKVEWRGGDLVSSLPDDPLE